MRVATLVVFVYYLLCLVSLSKFRAANTSRLPEDCDEGTELRFSFDDLKPISGASIQRLSSVGQTETASNGGFSRALDISWGPSERPAQIV